MKPVTWTRKQLQLFHEHGPQALRLSLTGLISAAHRATGYSERGESVYKYDWDILIILDACRYDLYQDIVGVKNTIRSPASMSKTWMERTFADEYRHERQNTAYVTGNPYSSELDPDDFALLDNVWEYGWDDEHSTVLPDIMVDRGIDVCRNRNDDYVVIHFMQPHEPFLKSPDLGEGMNRDGFGEREGVKDLNAWEQIAAGKINPKVVKDAYAQNLRDVLTHVSSLLENVDGTVAISADHGNALGEWGIWGHPIGVNIDALRRVPWDVRVCSDSHTRSGRSRSDFGTEDIETSVTDRLEQLGYMES